MDQNGHAHIPKTKLPETLLWPGYGYYMGLNSALFWQMGRLNCVFSTRTEKERFVGVFFGGLRAGVETPYHDPPGLSVHDQRDHHRVTEPGKEISLFL